MSYSRPGSSSCTWLVRCWAGGGVGGGRCAMQKAGPIDPQGWIGVCLQGVFCANPEELESELIQVSKK